MKSNCPPASRVLSLVAVGLLVAAHANAATSPAHIAQFSADHPTETLTTKSTSWRDPAFGEMGWTHSSDWGQFRVRKGQTVTITAESTNPNLHPGISVWFRPAKEDTAPNKYVAGHFYPQNANLFVLGAQDESTGEVVGNIVMKIVKYGYDQDGNTGQYNSKGVTDGVPGHLELTFQAKRTGTYQFVLGGFNPGPEPIDDAAGKTAVNTTVTVTP